MSGITLQIRILWFQGLFYLVTGLWPLMHIASFQAVTGPKADHLPFGGQADHWLVNTVAVLIVAISLVYLVAAYKRRLSVETLTLAIAAPVALAAIDCIYVYRDIIRPIYLADVVVELFFILFWSFTAFRLRR